MEASFLYSLKAIHIIGFICWFAGLFFLVRLFVYQLEAVEDNNPDVSALTRQYGIMQQRLYKMFVNPAMMITWTAGLTMLGLGFTDYAPNYLDPDLGTPGWMHAKLLLLVILLGYHIYMKLTMKKLLRGDTPMSAFKMRLLNDVPIILIAAIVFLAVLGLRGQLNYMLFGLGLLVFAGLLYLTSRLYMKNRKPGT